MKIRAEYITAIKCDSCGTQVSVDAHSYADALQQIGAVRRYGRLGCWGRVPPASSWNQKVGCWGPGLLDLCPRCYAREDKERRKRQSAWLRTR